MWGEKDGANRFLILDLHHLCWDGYKNDAFDTSAARNTALNKLNRAFSLVLFTGNFIVNIEDPPVIDSSKCNNIESLCRI